MEINVFVVDDSDVARKMLIRVLSEDPDIKIVGEAGTGVAGVMFLDDKKPDVVMLEADISGGMKLNDIVAEMKKLNPGLKIVLCADMRTKSDMIISASELGADELISKPYVKSRVLSVMREIKAALAGDKA